MCGFMPPIHGMAGQADRNHPGTKHPHHVDHPNHHHDDPAPADAGRDTDIALPRRRFLAAAAAAGLAGVTGAVTIGDAAPAAALSPRPTDRFLDLTHTITETFPWYPVFTPAQRRTPFRVETNTFYAQQWEIWEHTGTHLEAPGHFAANGRLIPDLALEEFIGVPIVLIDVAKRSAADPDTAVTAADLEAYEKSHGRMPEGAAVLMYSGWDERVNRPGAYLNAGPDGRLHSPGFAADAVDWLLTQRTILGIGVDTVSLDQGRALEDFPVHVKWLGADRWGMENLKGLGKVPPAGARLVAAPVPYQDGSAGQCRAFALLP